MRLLLVLLSFVFCSQFVFSQEDGLYEKYYDEGELKTKGQYLNKKRVGEWKNYYKNGQVSRIYSYEDGEKSKEYTSYYKDGVKRYQTQKEGEYYVSRGYFETGELQTERLLKNGYYKEFRENGTLKISSFYLDYQLFGTWSRFYEDGQLEWSVEFEDGYRNGGYINYYENGQVHVEGTIVKEMLEGKEKRYSEDGKLLWEGYYKNGLLNKTWTQFDATGAKVAKYKFKGGVILNEFDKPNLKPTEVPDGLIEKVPVFPGCNTVLGNRLKKKCMNEKIAHFIVSNFNTDVVKQSGIVGRQKIWVRFKIDKTGSVIAVEAKTPHPKLKNEAIRVIKLLPKMQPGMQKGRNVIVPYALPIVFQFE